tara:strand:- start:1078 stop:1281 length:204 start_codon:yes stop_codon:yes gene_type:complete
MDDVFNIEDCICRAFVLSLGVGLPSPNTIKDMINWINQEAEREKVALSNDYVYRCIPKYITFLFNKS